MRGPAFAPLRRGLGESPHAKDTTPKAFGGVRWRQGRDQTADGRWQMAKRNRSRRGSGEGPRKNASRHAVWGGERPGKNASRHAVWGGEMGTEGDELTC